MIRMYGLPDIKSVLHIPDLLKVIEEGFVLFSEGKVVVPPVGHMGFQDPPGDVHIKYGFIKGETLYVIKIASSFYHNPQYNLSSSNGMMLVFNQKTGEPEAILADEGYLTDIRTAAAGAVVARYLAPRNVRCIGIVGAGVQARLQLQFLKEVVACREVLVWGRDATRLLEYNTAMADHEFNMTTTTNIGDIVARCQLIVTATASLSPLLFGNKIRKGTHITAVGADTKNKQEIDASVFSVADIVVADSIDQCVDHGDTAHAIKAGTIQRGDLRELGSVIMNPACQRRNDEQITVADLTGIAVQDIQIAKYVYANLAETGRR